MDSLKAAVDSVVVGSTSDRKEVNRYVFLGPPGAGKGTQASLISEKLKIPAIATGAIFRAAIGKESALGRQVSQFVNSGLLVPDELTNAVVADRLKEKDCKNGFILDGYPRSLVQAKSLDTFLTKAKTPLTAVLYFKVDPAVVIERMGKRRVCGQCGTTFNLVSQPPKREGKCDKCGAALITRKDDEPTSIRKRMDVYDETTRPLLQYYEKKGVLKIFDASLPVQEVAKEVMQICGVK
jgi:adenylate kinase